MSPKKKKTYLAVVGVGVLGLAVDRLVLTDGATGPQLAQGFSFDVTAAATATPVTAKSKIPAVPFPKDIPRLGDGVTLRDVFVKPGTAGAPALDAARTLAEADKSKRPKDLGHAAFAQTHKLTAVFSDEGTEIAVVDGTWIQVGQTITGCRLEGVDVDEALFRCHDGPATLKISDAIPGARN